MAVTWPPSLPRMPLQEGYQLQKPASRWTFQPDEGPLYTRPKAMQGDKFAMTFVFTLEQLAIFKEWHKSSLAGGVLPFDYVDPDTGEAVQMQFDQTSSQDYTSNFFTPFRRKVSMVWQVLP